MGNLHFRYAMVPGVEAIKPQTQLPADAMGSFAPAHRVASRCARRALRSPRSAAERFSAPIARRVRITLVARGLREIRARSW